MRLGETPGCLQLRASSRLIGSAAAPRPPTQRVQHSNRSLGAPDPRADRAFRPAPAGARAAALGGRRIGGPRSRRGSGAQPAQLSSTASISSP